MFYISYTYQTLDCELSSEALLDIGASACFMDKDYAMKHSLELIRKAYSVPMEVIDGQPLALGNVMEETQPLEVILRNQIFHVTFNIIQCCANAAILGLP
jgi:hypothetical protein